MEVHLRGTILGEIKDRMHLALENRAPISPKNRMASPTLVVKVLIAVLSVVSAAEKEQKRNDPHYFFKDIQRYWTECPTNKVLYTANRSEPTQMVELKRAIDKEHPLLITVNVTKTATGDIVYSGKDLDICVYNDWTEHSWNFVAVRIFKVSMMPMYGWHSCPIKPERYEIRRWQHTMEVAIPAKVDSGNYEISYTAKSDDELVFSKLKFWFVSTVDDPDWPPQYNW